MALDYWRDSFAKSLAVTLADWYVKNRRAEIDRQLSDRSVESVMRKTRGAYSKKMIAWYIVNYTDILPDIVKLAAEADSGDPVYFMMKKLRFQKLTVQRVGDPDKDKVMYRDDVHWSFVLAESLVDVLAESAYELEWWRRNAKEARSTGRRFKIVQKVTES